MPISPIHAISRVPVSSIFCSVRLPWGWRFPLYAYWQHLRKMVLPLTVALLAGSLYRRCFGDGAGQSARRFGRIHSLSGAKIGHHAHRHEHRRKIGGLPSLTAVLCGRDWYFRRCRVFRFFSSAAHSRSQSPRDLPSVLAAHGLGTARAFQISEEMGAFATLGMSL